MKYRQKMTFFSTVIFRAHFGSTRNLRHHYLRSTYQNHASNRDVTNVYKI